MQNEIVSRAEWLEARARLLAREKEHTKARAALAAERRALPWVQLDKDYELTGADGPIPFADLFRDRRA